MTLRVRAGESATVTVVPVPEESFVAALIVENERSGSRSIAFLSAENCRTIGAALTRVGER